jgi:hypothetical protein
LKTRMLPRTFVLLGALLALASLHPLPARAEAPSSAVVERLDDRLGHGRRVRITTPTGKLVAEGVWVNADGITYRKVLSTIDGQTLPTSNHFPWEDVARVDVPSNHALAGFLITGAVVGGVVGWGVYSSGRQGNDIGGAGIGLLGVPVIAVLGGVVGSRMPSWHAVWRRR